MKGISQETARLGQDSLEPGMGSGGSGTFIPGYKSFQGLRQGWNRGLYSQWSLMTAPGCLWPLNQPPSTLDMHIAQTGLGPLPSCTISRSRKGLCLLGMGKWIGNLPRRFYSCLSTLNAPSKQ